MKLLPHAGNPEGHWLGALTDGPLSPIGTRPAVVLQVRDPDWFGFRSIVAQTCLAQVLVISVTAALSKHT